MKGPLGFVGLGQMGQLMAFNLLRATDDETELRVFDIRETQLAPLIALGASQVFRLAEVAEPGSIVFTRVPTDDVLLQIALGEGGILQRLGSGGVHVALSTVSPQISAQLARCYAEHSNAYLAAPVLGSLEMAELAQLSIFVAGEASAKKRVMPLLAAIGEHRYDLGEQVEVASLLHCSLDLVITAILETMKDAAALAGQARQLSQGVGITLPYTEILAEQVQAAKRIDEDWSALAEMFIERE